MRSHNAKSKILTIIFFCSFYQLAFAGIALSRGEKAGEVSVLDDKKAMPGKFSYVAPLSGWLVEIDLNGTIVNSFKIPSKYRENLRSAADVEWIPQLNEFLIVSPKKGVFRAKLNGDVSWSCDSNFISHDADYLQDGSVVYVNGWDDLGEDEPIFTWLNKECEVIHTIRASELKLKKERFRADKNNPTDNSHTHTNAVQLISNDLVLLSLRNYDEIIVVSLKKKKIVRRYYKAKHVHDPMPVDPNVSPKDMEFFYADRARGQRLMQTRSKPERKKPRVIWNSIDREPDFRGIKNNGLRRLWTPLRTVEILPNGNFLLTGSAYLGQVTKNGELVWEIRLNGFVNQHEYGDYIYKAAFRE